MEPEKNAKFGPGAKKPGVSSVPPVAMIHLGMVMKNGSDKYGPFNWREGGVDLKTYYDASMRHLMLMWEGEVNDRESGLPHAAHVMACMAILLDAMELAKLQSNNPELSGMAGDLIDRISKE